MRARLHRPLAVVLDRGRSRRSRARRRPSPAARARRRRRRPCRPGRSGRSCGCARRRRRAPSSPAAGARLRACRAARPPRRPRGSTHRPARSASASSPDGERAGQRPARSPERRDHRASRRLSPPPATRAKMSTVMKPDAQEVLRHLQLLGVLVDERQRGVGGREAVRVHHAVACCRDRSTRPAACGSRRRSAALRRVVERARALARDAARLPVVVVVEAAEPAVGVDRHVEVHLVAGGAELGGLSRMNGFMKVSRCGSGSR